MSLNDLVYLCGVLGTVWGVFKIIKDLKKPIDGMKETLRKHEQHLANDKAEIDEIKEGNKVICKSIMTMINHELTGNDVSNMREMRDELQNYLIEK